ncbi:TolC family protein [Aestuariispira ectoiniformans]|uniref:TolC family protein n=1 Tax=Aestuariispira ectoiniformans TaxID=2775080 RepID=UPI00223B97EA|nr:TolC family protein [Aestuariispira ectoiniformans]
MIIRSAASHFRSPVAKAQKPPAYGPGLSVALVLGASVILAGCSVTPEPMTMADHVKRVEADRDLLFKGQEKVTAPITLYEAIARALKYNLDQRLKLMETALAQQNLTASNLDLLPQLTAEAGYTGRDNFNGSNSRSLITGQESLESSTSQDRDLRTASLGLTWNLLDFGLSYVRAQQTADRVLIAEERRRKVVHNITQDVRAAFWNAVSAERLLKRIAPLSRTVETALNDVREAQETGQETPLSALRYQRELLDTLRQLKLLRRELNAAKTQLATLMNLEPGTEYSLDPGPVDFSVPQVNFSNVDKLEKIALLHRPELREEAYQQRISHKDVQRAYLRLLPGLELNGGLNYDSNSYAWEQNWFSWGASINKNLFEVFTGPQRIDLAEARVDVVDYRRYAMSMAVMSQVHIALAGYKQAVDEFNTVSELYQVESNIQKQIRANVQTGSSGPREAIRADLQSLLAQLRRDLAFAEMRNSVGRLYLSLGADPLPDSVASNDVSTLATEIKTITEGWFSGDVKLSDGSDLEKRLSQGEDKKEEDETFQKPVTFEPG